MTSKKEKAKVKHMSSEEKKNWEELYNYVRKTILEYDENQSLSKQMVLRLKGLSTSKFFENRLHEDKSNYSFNVVLNTFKFWPPEIEKSVQRITFKDENNKFNYILKIVESKLNDVYIKMKNTERSKEKIKQLNLNAVNNQGADYNRKTKDVSDKFSEFW